MSGRLLGVVLCGGRSSRMGRDKAMLAHPWGGTFLSHAVDRLSKLCEEVCIAGGVHPETTHRVLSDNLEFRGPATGIASALAAVEAESFDGCLITPIDMPFLSSNDLSRLRDVWLKDTSQLVCGVSQENDRLQPLVAIYPARSRLSVCELAGAIDRSVYHWISRQPYVSVHFSATSCRNINTSEDLTGLAD